MDLPLERNPCTTSESPFITSLLEGSPLCVLLANIDSMADDDDGPVYYVISDLHIGGDEQLGEVDFLDKLLEFLERLETTDENAELLINGDAFGLWEFTEVSGLAKFDVLTENYPELFEQLRTTGESVPITLMPGNHDNELAAYDEYVERLAQYNVTLVLAESITRPVGDRTIWFEHGHQQDPNNRLNDFGNPYETPIGYPLQHPRNEPSRPVIRPRAVQLVEGYSSGHTN